jgi:hypothetical protein
MRKLVLIGCIVSLLAAGRTPSTSLAAQKAQNKTLTETSLRVAVTDPAGAAIQGARVDLILDGKNVKSLGSNEQGEVYFPLLAPGKYRVMITAQGFSQLIIKELDLRSEPKQIKVELAVAPVKDEITVSQSSREKATDPNSTAFSSILTPEQIAQLPDDPEEFEARLRQMAGPGALIRVNGFAGGKLPPKDQIQEIRFRLNPYAAENHNGGLLGVDILTKPGIDVWHGTFNFGFRPGTFAARNAFAPVHGPEQYRRFGLNLEGPIWKNRTSLFLNGEGYYSYESKTIVAAVPTGNLMELVRRPSRALNLSARLEHILTKSHTLRAEYQRNANRQENLGTGDFDLPSRGFSTDVAEHLMRIADTGLLTQRIVNDFRFQTTWRDTGSHSLSNAPAILVLNAFDDGGAQVNSDRRVRDTLIEDDFSFAVKKHSMKSGFSLDNTSYVSDELLNSTGTFTFSSLAGFLAEQPATFTMRTGNPRVQFNQTQFGWFWQDDMRLRENLTVSVGLRQELQSNLSRYDNFAPRVGFAWAPFPSGNTTIRAGAGIFYDWFTADAFETTLRVNGKLQQDVVVLNPGFPNPFAGTTPLVLPPSIYRQDPAAKMPYVEMFSMSVEREIAKKVQLRTTVWAQRDVHQLRSHNLNAPVPGVGRPDPASGNINQIESTANGSNYLFNINANTLNPGSRLYWILFYSWQKQINEADSALSLPGNNYDLRAERGPALTDARHSFFGILNLRAYKGVRVGGVFHAESALPYNITTGFDNNGDGVVNDRPNGVERNSGRGSAQWDFDVRISWAFGFGKVKDSTPRGRAGVLRPGGDVETLAALSPGSSSGRFRCQLYFQAFNLLNHTNLTNFVGVQTSPFFGHATAALPGRRLETGLRFSF